MADKIAALQEKLVNLHLLDESKIVALQNSYKSKITLNSIKEAAVLYLVYYFDSKPHVLLTERSKAVKRFPGQICLPGGHCEQGETASDAVLREVEEEVGIPKGVITLLGVLPARLVTMDILVTPFVAILNQDYDPYQLTLCPHEVESAFWAPIELFLSSVSHTTSSAYAYNALHEVHIFKHLDDASNRIFPIFGMTALLCIVASSVFLDRLPDYPFTYISFQPQPCEDGRKNKNYHIDKLSLSLRLRSLL